MNEMLRLLDLFSGIGGFSYAAQQIWGKDLEIVSFCEIDKFCQKVLKKHWPDVEIVNDIKDERIKQFRDIDLLTAGVPCQPASVAGAQRGTIDERWLWPETLAIIRLVRPRYALLENVPGLFGLEDGFAFNGILSGLAEIGYDCWWEVIPACAVGAPHRRDRIWIIAYSIKSGTRHNDRKITDERRQTCTDRTAGIRQENGAIDSSRINTTNRDVTDPANNGQSQRKSTSSIYERQELQIQKQSGDRRASSIERCDNNVADTESNRLQGRGMAQAGQNDITSRNCENAADTKITELNKCRTSRRRRDGFADNNPWNENWFEVATRFCRVADGIPDRMDRLKSLGNAIVPQVAIVIMQAIKEIDE